jgi:hypothetical protein
VRLSRVDGTERAEAEARKLHAALTAALVAAHAEPTSLLSEGISEPREQLCRGCLHQEAHGAFAQLEIRAWHLSLIRAVKRPRLSWTLPSTINCASNSKASLSSSGALRRSWPYRVFQLRISRRMLPDPRPTKAAQIAVCTPGGSLR